MKLDFSKYKWDYNQTVESEAMAGTMLSYVGQKTIAKQHNDCIEEIKEDLRAWLKGAKPLLKPPKLTKELTHRDAMYHKDGFETLKEMLLTELGEAKK